MGRSLIKVKAFIFSKKKQTQKRQNQAGLDRYWLATNPVSEQAALSLNDIEKSNKCSGEEDLKKQKKACRHGGGRCCITAGK